jgi:hypothetical protein
MALPINFEQFAKDPLKAIMFLVVCAVGYLYVDNKMNLNAQIEKCDKNVQELNVKTDILEVFWSTFELTKNSSNCGG